MKKLIAIYFLSLPLLTAAQGFNGDTGCDCFSNKKKGDKIPFFLGLNGGYFMQDYIPPGNTKSMVGSPYGGIMFGAHIASFLSIQTGVSYTYANNVDVFNPDIQPQIPIDGASMSVQYLEVPLEIQLRLIVYHNWTIYLQPGVYNNMLIKRDTKYGDNLSTSESGLQYNRMYAGGGLGFGYILGKKWMVFAQAEYHTSILSGESILPDFKARYGARAGITYTFRKKKK